MAEAKNDWPEWRFDRYRNGNKMAEGIRVKAPNYDAAHAKAMGLADRGDSICLDEGVKPDVSTTSPEIRITGLENDPTSPSAIQAKSEAAAIYEQVAGDPEVYEALFKMMSQETDALPQRQALEVAFVAVSQNLDEIVEGLQGIDRTMAEAVRETLDLRRAASREKPDPDVDGGLLEAAAMHVEAMALMQAATARLWRFASWWSQVPIEAEGWEHFREEAANQLNIFR